jgi:hypothetical protein
MSTYSTFPFFCYYTHDIEDGEDATQHCESLGGGDFLIYNLLLLWLLPPLLSITIQLCLLIAFIINIQIGFMVTDWIGSLWKENLMPTVPLRVILISGCSIILQFIVQSFHTDNVNILY